MIKYVWVLNVLKRTKCIRRKIEGKEGDYMPHLFLLELSIYPLYTNSFQEPCQLNLVLCVLQTIANAVK